MSTAIDLDFRPPTYFRPRPLDRYLLSKVKGAVVRKRLLALYDAGAHAEVRALLTARGIPEELRLALEATHPMYMGGNYLPDHDDGEVEIARISIESTTGDVTSVYARPAKGAIRYRVVDEYEGGTLQGRTTARTNAPMTLRELADFFLAAWPLMDVLEMNFGADRAKSLAFFVAQSDFYPDLDRLCRERVMERFPEPEPAEASND